MKTHSRQIALVTGAGGCIGAAISKKLASNIDALIVVDIDPEKLLILKHSMEKISSIPIGYYLCDVGQSIEVKNTLDKARQDIGTPSILINNAGIGGPFHRVDEVSDEEWHNIMNTNLKGLFNFCKTLLPSMKQMNFGRIINIASVQGYLGAALSSTYVASKHGVIGYTRAIAAEWGQYGITCNAVCPGYVDTSLGIQNDKITNHAKHILEKTPAGRIAEPEEIADLVFHLTKKETAFINGTTLTIDGGLTCHVGVS